jgi:hypothetical protein
VTIFYSDSPIEELAISAGRDELVSLAEKLLRGESPIDCEGGALDPSPYRMLLRRILVSIEPGALVDLQVNEGGDLLISGSRENLSQFANEVSAFADDERLADHMHVEHYDGHFYLSPDAVPLVISRPSGSV